MRTDLKPPTRVQPGCQADFACPPGSDADDGFGSDPWRKPVGRHAQDRTPPMAARRASPWQPRGQVLDTVPFAVPGRP